MTFCGCTVGTTLTATCVRWLSWRTLSEPLLAGWSACSSRSVSSAQFLLQRTMDLLAIAVFPFGGCWWSHAFGHTLNTGVSGAQGCRVFWLEMLFAVVGLVEAVWGVGWFWVGWVWKGDDRAGLLIMVTAMATVVVVVTVAVVAVVVVAVVVAEVKEATIFSSLWTL